MAAADRLIKHENQNGNSGPMTAQSAWSEGSSREAMREHIQTRLEGLKKELETGRGALEKVEQQRTYLHEMILRIAGAIQVLEELLAEAQTARRDETGQGDT